MILCLEQRLERKQVKSRKHRPLTTCPCCQSKELFQFEQDYMCSDCGWESFASSVARGDMDFILNIPLESLEISDREKNKSVQEKLGSDENSHLAIGG